MAQQIINTGSFDDDPSAEKVRSGFQKVNANDTELYNRVGTLETTVANIPVVDFEGNIPTKVFRVNVDHNAAGDPFDKVRDAINALPTFTLTDFARTKFVTERFVVNNTGGGVEVINGVNYDIIRTFYELKFNYQILGTGGTQLTDAGQLLLEEDGFSSTVNLAATENDLGDIGATPINEAVNAAGPFGTPLGAFNVFKKTVGGASNRAWLYVGSKDQIGTGLPETSLDEYRELPTDLVSGDPAPDPSSTVYIKHKDQVGNEFVANTKFTWGKGVIATPDPEEPGAANIDIGVNASQLGELINIESFSDTSDFTIVGDATASVNGNNELVVGTTVDGGSDNYLRYDPIITDLEKFRIVLEYNIFSAPTATSFGIGVGLIPERGVSGGYGQELQFSMTTVGQGSGGGRKILSTLNNGTYTVQYDGIANRLQFSQGDKMRLTLQQDNGNTQMLIENLTTGLSAVASYDYTIPTPVIPNVSKFAIWAHGGTYNVSKFEITSHEHFRPELVVIGDSKSRGYNATNFGTDYVSQMNDFFSSVVNLSGGSERVADVLNRIPDITRLRPIRAVLNIGSNNKRDGDSVAVWSAGYDSIASQLEAAGIDVYHELLFNESVLDFTDYNNHTIATYPASRVYDVGTLTLDGDGVHPAQAGHDTAAQKNIDKFSEIIPIPDRNNLVTSNLHNEPRGSKVITNIVSLTQAQYDAGVKNPTTLYVIT